MKKFFLLFAVLIFAISFSPVSAQQVIGSFPTMDGGLEGQTATTTLTSSANVTTWSVSTTSAPTRSIINNASIARTGNKYAAFALTGTNTRLQTTTGSNLLASTQYTVQYYYKVNTDPTGFLSAGVYLNGTTGGVNQNVTTSFTSGVWSKAVATLTSSTTITTTFACARLVTGYTEAVNIDDFVVYAGTEDNTIPGGATTSVVDGATSASLNVSWSAPGTGVDGGGYIVVRGTVDPTTAPNQNGIYAVGNSIGSGTVAYIGTGTSFTDNGLNPTTNYFYRIYTVDKAFNYSTALTASGTTDALVLATEPTIQASNLSYSAIGTNAITLTWTNGNGASRIVLAKAISAVSSDPVDGNGYAANPIFTSGALIGTGNYVVHSGSGNSVTVTGLSPATNYHFAVYEFNGSAGTQNYLTSTPLTGNQPTNATTITSAQSGNWGATSTWVGGVIPTSTDNVVIANTHTVELEATPKNCYNLTIDNGGKLWANTVLTTNRYVRVYGNSITNNGILGDNADGLSIETYLSNGTLTLSGTGITKINRMRPGASVINHSIVFNTDATFTYTGTGGTGGASLYSSNSANDNISITVNAGKTVTFNTFSNFSSNASIITDGLASQAIVINGSVILNGTANMNIRTAASKASSVTVNGTLNVGGGLYTNGATVPTITVGAAGSLLVKGNADYTNPAMVVTGAGSYTQESGTMLIGNVSGVNATGSSGTIQTATRNFLPAVSFTYNGTSAQTAGTAIANATNLTIDNATGVSLSNAVTLSASLTLSSGTLTTGANNLTLGAAASASLAPGTVLDINNVSSTVDFAARPVTLKSTSAGTARIATILGTLDNATNVTMERWIPLRGNSATGGRAYRLLAPTVNTTGSIQDNWMEGGMNTVVGTNVNLVPNYGTQISGAGGNANGFDVTQSNSSSLYAAANALTPTYTAIGNTATNLNALTGYFLYIRGDRSVSMQVPLGTNMPATSTTLRTTGTVVTGTQTTFTNAYVGGGALNLVTNPYPSPIDWSLVKAASSNITNFYTLWDPNIGTRGGFVTVNTAGVPSAGTANQYIQPGQAFFVEHDNVGPAPVVSIQENQKTSGNNNTVFFVASPPVESFNVGLFFTEDSGYRRQADGVNVLYDNGYSALVNAEDAKEINNWDENIAINRENKHLAIEGRPVILTRDTIPLFMNNMKQRAYEFEFTPSLFTNIGLKAELVDNFLNTRTLLSVVNNTVVPFSITSDPASAADNRFTILFGPLSPLAIDVLTISAKVKNNDVEIDWSSKTEKDMDRYEVERSFDGSGFNKINTTVAKGNSPVAVNYSWVDANAQVGKIFYRIKAIDKAGQFKYTDIVKVDFNKVASTPISISPNPVIGNIIKLQLNDIEKGNYEIAIYNNLGQVVYNTQLQHAGGSAVIPVTLVNSLANGIYKLVVSGQNFRITNNFIKN